jgi:hypothetical protein
LVVNARKKTRFLSRPLTTSARSTQKEQKNSLLVFRQKHTCDA